MTRPRAAARTAALVVAFAGLLASCHGGEGTARTPTSTPTPHETATATATAPALGADVWLAALRIARDPNDLDADAQLLLSRVDGATVVSPASCFRGLPDGPGPSDYILGVVAATRSALDELVARSGFASVFEVNVRVSCID